MVRVSYARLAWQCRVTDREIKNVGWNRVWCSDVFSTSSTTWHIFYVKLINSLAFSAIAACLLDHYEGLWPSPSPLDWLVGTALRTYSKPDRCHPYPSRPDLHKVFEGQYGACLKSWIVSWSTFRIQNWRWPSIRSFISHSFTTWRDSESGYE